MSVLCVCRADDDSVQSVGDWLSDLNLEQYENTLIANGYDNMDFMVIMFMECLVIRTRLSDTRCRPTLLSSYLNVTFACEATMKTEWRQKLFIRLQYFTIWS